MAKISLYLDTRHKPIGGKYPLKLSVAHRGTSSFYNTGVSLLPEWWQRPTSDTDGYVKKNCKDSKRYNNHIQSLQDMFSEHIQRLEQNQQLYPFRSARDLKNYIANIIEGRNQATVLAYFKKCMDDRTNEGTKGLYRETYLKLKAFTNDSDILFEHITPLWLDRFSDFIGGSVNYKAIHLRNLRAVYNKAIRNNVTSLSSYPFYKYRIKKEATAKRSLSIEQLAEIADMELPSHQKRYRDLLMLSFYLVGINMVDLLNLKPENLRDGRLIYKRHKTSKIYDIKVEKEALDIIDKYRGKTYLLKFLETSKYDNIFRRMNRGLKTLGPEAIINDRGKKQKSDKYKYLSSYYARHTWATIAAYLDVPKETIAAALGHDMGNTTTAIYINFDQRKVDDANRAVLDYLASVRKRKVV